MSKRMTVAVLAYVLSSAGILLMCQLILEELRKPKGSNMLVFLWLGAWLSHVEEDYMSKVPGDSHLVEQTMHSTARQLIFIQPQNAIR